MSEIKISNELLSWVLGCEIYNSRPDDYESIKSSFGNMYISTLNTSTKIKGIKFLGWSKDPQKNYALIHSYRVNIHEFINLAKIKAFECGYQITVESHKVVIINTNNPNKKINIMSRVKQFLNDGDVFEVNVILNALEWVCKETGEKNE